MSQDLDELKPSTDLRQKTTFWAVMLISVEKKLPGLYNLCRT